MEEKEKPESQNPQKSKDTCKEEEPPVEKIDGLDQYTFTDKL